MTIHELIQALLDSPSHSGPFKVVIRGPQGDHEIATTHVDQDVFIIDLGQPL